MKAEVNVTTVTNIQGAKQLYVTVATEKGKVHISVGEKNYAKLTEILAEPKPNKL